jgi:hypothetical protein
MNARLGAMTLHVPLNIRLEPDHELKELLCMKSFTTSASFKVNSIGLSIPAQFDSAEVPFDHSFDGRQVLYMFHPPLFSSQSSLRIEDHEPG